MAIRESIDDGHFLGCALPFQKSNMSYSSSVSQTTYVCEGHCFRGRVAAVCCPSGPGSKTSEVCFVGLGGIRVLCGTVCIGAVAPATQAVQCNNTICGQTLNNCCRPPCGMVGGGWIVLGGKSKCYTGQWGSSCCGATCEPTACQKWSLEYSVVSESAMSCAFTNSTAVIVGQLQEDQTVVGSGPVISNECARPRWYRLGEGVVTIQTGAGAVFQLLDVEATSTVLQPTIQVPWQAVDQTVATLSTSIPIIEPLVPISVQVARSSGGLLIPLGPCSGSALVYAITPSTEAAEEGDPIAVVVVWGSVASTITGTVTFVGGERLIQVDRAVNFPIGAGISAFSRILFPGDALSRCNPILPDPSICSSCCPVTANFTPSPCAADDTLIGLNPPASTILPAGIQYCANPEAPVRSNARSIPVALTALSALNSSTRDFCSANACENVQSGAVPAASFDRLVGVVPFSAPVPTGAISIVLQPAVTFQNPDLLPAAGDLLSILPNQLSTLVCPLPAQPIIPVVENVVTK